MQTPFYLLLKFYTFYWDLRLGVNTRGRFEQTGPPENFKYSTLSYKQILSILKKLNIGVDDVFYDLGCGRGRVLCAAQVFEPRKIVGVEINRELAEISKENLEKIQGRKSAFEIINRSAADCDYKEGTVFYLYNPFGPDILERVLLHIQESLPANPRNIKVAYVHANFNERLEQCDWLHCTDIWDHQAKYPFIPFTTFWKSKIS